MDAVECVEIDSSGRFKYILVKVTHDGQHKYIVRGNKRAAYHASYPGLVSSVGEMTNKAKQAHGYEAGFIKKLKLTDIYDEILPGIENLGLKAECLGGGRIEHNKDEKSILIYGYSLGFGSADHSITADILKKFYATYSNITFSNEGY